MLLAQVVTALVVVFTTPTTATMNPQHCYTETITMVLGVDGWHEHVHEGTGCDVHDRRRGLSDLQHTTKKGTR